MTKASINERLRQLAKREFSLLKAALVVGFLIFALSFPLLIAAEYVWGREFDLVGDASKLAAMSCYAVFFLGTICNLAVFFVTVIRADARESK